MKTSSCQHRTSLAGFISALLLAVSVDAATISVNSTADAGSNCPGASCTLPQAIATALNGGRINFAGMATINLTSGELLINMNLLSVQRSAVSPTPDFRSANIASPGANTAIPGLK